MLLLELLVLLTCIQALWHKMAHRKNRRDCTGVSPRALLVPASSVFHWEGKLEVLLWCLPLCFLLQLSPTIGLEQLKWLWLPVSLHSSWLLLLLSVRARDESFRPQGDKVEGRFEGESSGDTSSIPLKQWRWKPQFLLLSLYLALRGNSQPCCWSVSQAK